MATLSTLKARIAADLSRSDLTSRIASAIEDAIYHYQRRRFYFNQARDTFATVAGTEFYTSGTDPEDIPEDVAEVDALTITVSGRRYTLEQASFAELEQISTTTDSRGQPTMWAWYAQQVRLFPVPDAAYTVTMSYLQRIPVPASDGASNAWTTEAEQLIRACATKNIRREQLADDRGAQRAEIQEMNALRRLIMETNKLSTGPLMPSGW